MSEHHIDRTSAAPENVDEGSHLLTFSTTAKYYKSLSTNSAEITGPSSEGVMYATDVIDDSEDAKADDTEESQLLPPAFGESTLTSKYPRFNRLSVLGPSNVSNRGEPAPFGIGANQATLQVTQGKSKWGLDDFDSDSRKNTPLKIASSNSDSNSESQRNNDVEMGLADTLSLNVTSSSPPLTPSITIRHLNEYVPSSTKKVPKKDNTGDSGIKAAIPAQGYQQPLTQRGSNTGTGTGAVPIIHSRPSPLSWIWYILYAVLAIACFLAYSKLQHQISANSQKMNEISRRLDAITSDVTDFKNKADAKMSKLSLDLSNIHEQEVSLESFVFKEIGQTKRNMTAIHSQNNATESHISRLITDVNNHDKIIARLNNRTSNAEVLDELKVTKHFVTNELMSTKYDIAKTLDMTNQNVTLQMQRTHNELNTTIAYMRILVASAADEIYSVQSDVTGQLAIMESNLKSTVNDLNEMVDFAKETISEEVSGVKEDIEMYVAATNKEFAVQNDFVKYQLAGTFTLLGCLISLWHMTSHLRHNYKPDVQRRVMAVLWMVPIYGITSWLSLVVPSFEGIFGALRDCYEAYAVYTFIGLLIAILEEGKGLQELIKLLAHHVEEERQAIAAAVEATAECQRLRKPKPAMPVEHLKPPFPCGYDRNNPSSVAAAWLHQCMIMALQFVLFKPLLTVIPFVLTMSGVDYDVPLMLDRHSVNWTSPKVYVIFLQNISVAIAFYGLLSFYHGTEKDLAWCDPWPKFLCIKGVVFMTFWQGATLQLMSTLGLVDSHTATQFQNLLICIEMLLASIAHFYIFPYQEWRDGYKNDKIEKSLLKDTLALRDFYRDMRRMVTRWDEGTPLQVPAPHEGEDDSEAQAEAKAKAIALAHYRQPYDTSEDNTPLKLEDNVVGIKGSDSWSALNGDMKTSIFELVSPSVVFGSPSSSGGTGFLREVASEEFNNSTVLCNAGMEANNNSNDSDIEENDEEDEDDDSEMRIVDSPPPSPKTLKLLDLDRELELERSTTLT